jgi:drug/metabolite transporter (DMT)-like permease
VYAFVLDFVINGETITLIELVGVLMILAVTISVSVIKLRQEMMLMKDQ